jgi:hypothetical protein
MKGNPMDQPNTVRLSRNGHRFLAPPKVFNRWNDLPYGVWTTRTGRQVLFNRFYEPIWQREPDKPPEPADAAEWVKEIVNQQWFYGDENKTEASMRRAASAALESWGVPMP